MDMEYDIVVKVKYGDTLRRFVAHVNEGLGVVDLKINDLRAKCFNFFNLSPDLDFTFTYIDEDGDIVTLGDDGDLCDAAIGQHLDPLRITVLAKTAKTETPEKRSSNEASAASSSSVSYTTESPSSIINGVQDALKSVPEPLRNVLLKFSNDFISKVASSAPMLAELVDSYSKMGPPLQNQHNTVVNTSSLKQQDTVINAPANSSDRAVDLNVAPGGEASRDSVPSRSTILYPTSNIPEVMPDASGVERSLADNLRSGGGGNMYSGVTTDVNYDLFFSKGDVSSDLPKEAIEMPATSAVKSPFHYGSSVLPGLAVGSVVANNVDQLLGYNPFTSQPVESSKTSIPSIGYSTFADGEKYKQSPTLESSASHVVSNSHDSLPAKDAGEHISNFRPYRAFPLSMSFKGNYGQPDSMLRTFHRGIQCDGCGMLPIMGPRFKSNVKDDFDLCNICFSEMGNEADYSRIDRATYHPPGLVHPPRSFSASQAIRGCCKKKPLNMLKLESRFIQDVTILDGTVVTPGTPFTKIWRMRNNGTTVWPQGTRLVWIGGDSLRDGGSVDLEIPACGFPVNKEFDIAVDFKAPSQPGRYISYWKMSSRSGQKFGQRVWVLIQVDNGLGSVSDRFNGLNLNLPPESDGQKGKGIVIDVNVKPADGNPFVPEVTHRTAELVNPVVEEPLNKSGGLDRQNSDANSTVANEPIIPSLQSTAPVSYPIIDLSDLSPAAEVPARPSAVTVTEANGVELALLKELDEMGFKQTDLNKEVLRKNKYDLEESVEDLCGIAEWDPLLEELQEMGFSDREVNKKLLIKNGGSIKKVVLDLITGKKA